MCLHLGAEIKRSALSILGQDGEQGMITTGWSKSDYHQVKRCGCKHGVCFEWEGIASGWPGSATERLLSDSPVNHFCPSWAVETVLAKSRLYWTCKCSMLLDVQMLLDFKFLWYNSIFDSLTSFFTIQFQNLFLKIACVDWHVLPSSL